MNKLKSYLDSSGQTQAAFAAKIGVTQAYVAKLCRHGAPSIRVALEIEKETGGAVSVQSWVTK